MFCVETEKLKVKQSISINCQSIYHQNSFEAAKVDNGNGNKTKAKEKKKQSKLDEAQDFRYTPVKKKKFPQLPQYDKQKEILLYNKNNSSCNNKNKAFAGCQCQLSNEQNEQQQQNNK